MKTFKTATHKMVSTVKGHMRQSIHHRFESICVVQGLIISVSSAGYVAVKLGVERVQHWMEQPQARSHTINCDF